MVTPSIHRLPLTSNPWLTIQSGYLGGSVQCPPPLTWHLFQHGHSLTLDPFCPNLLMAAVSGSSTSNILFFLSHGSIHGSSSLSGYIEWEPSSLFQCIAYTQTFQVTTLRPPLLLSLQSCIGVSCIGAPGYASICRMQRATGPHCTMPCITGILLLCTQLSSSSCHGPSSDRSTTSFYPKTTSTTAQAAWY